MSNPPTKSKQYWLVRLPVDVDEKDLDQMKLKIKSGELVKVKHGSFNINSSPMNQSTSGLIVAEKSAGNLSITRPLAGEITIESKSVEP